MRNVNTAFKIIFVSLIKIENELFSEILQLFYVKFETLFFAYTIIIEEDIIQETFIHCLN